MSSAISYKASVLEEPKLRFGLGQFSRDPKEGLFLFGPVRELSNPTEVRCGVIGTLTGIASYRAWVEKISKAIPAPLSSRVSVFYPGFKQLFNCSWSSKAVVELVVSPGELAAVLHRSDRHEAIHSTVGIFASAINAFLVNDDRRVDIWFVVIPDEVFDLGRPNSRLAAAQRIQSSASMNAKLAKRLRREPSLFPEDMKAAEPYLYKLDFHNQLKARLIKNRAVTQVIRESTLVGEIEGVSKRRMQDAASIAWNISVSSFYKAGGRPWRLGRIRDGVCYVGLVFKIDDRGPDKSYACCGAQMFLSNGEGMVFKGTPGPWYSPSTREFHLSKEQAAELGNRIIKAYTAEVGCAPSELFIHGRTRFNDEEWSGFESAIPKSTRAAGIRISRTDEFKLFRPGRMPVIRGTLVIQSETVGYLWTSGFVPELDTYPGWEVPNPLRLERCRGNASITTIAEDVFQLTKLNFNACIYGDGMPVTLRFADAIGEILTAAPSSDIPEMPLSFRHYI